MGKRKRAVTLRDIAKRCGVSHNAVSLALRGSTEVSAGTRERVADAARSMGYRPSRNATAGRLAARKTGGRFINRAVGLVFPLYVHGVRYFDLVYAGVMAELAGSGNVVTHFDMHSPAQRRIVREVPDAFVRDEIDGLIVLPARCDFAPVVRRLRDEEGFGERPVVTLMERLAGCSSVAADEERGAYLAAAHALSRGCTRIVQLVVEGDSAGARRRVAGVKRAMAEAGVRPARRLTTHTISPLDLDPTTLRLEGDPRRLITSAKALVAAAASGRGRTAVLAYNDACAVRVWRAMSEAGIEFRDEVCIVGFDGVDDFADLSGGFALSTVRLPLNEIGAEAARMVMRQASCVDHEAEHVELAPELVVRDT